MKGHLFNGLMLLISFVFPLDAYELAIVTMFRNEGFYLNEWIEYHRMVGVDHFWLYNNNSTDHWESVLKPYIDEGLVEVIDWPSPLNESHEHERYVVRQTNAFKDGIRRAITHAKWVAFIDCDEFILPMKNTCITECLDKHFSEASAVFINWRNFGTGGTYIPEGEPILFRLTACSLAGHTNNNIGKSIVRPETVYNEELHSPHHFILKPGFQYVDGDGNMMNYDYIDLKPDLKSHTKYLRINHYVLRDESFFHNKKLPRAERWFSDKALLLEHYESFSLISDYAIINFIKKFHPEMFSKIWKEYQ